MYQDSIRYLKNNKWLVGVVVISLGFHPRERQFESGTSYYLIYSIRFDKNAVVVLYYTHNNIIKINAFVVELVDTQDLGSCFFGSVGSTPIEGTVPRSFSLYKTKWAPQPFCGHVNKG